MIPRAMDSLETVEMIMLIEEIFETEIPSCDAEEFGSPCEIVDWLESHLANRRPNKKASAHLKKLADDHGNPALAQGLNGTWRREQIAALVREIYR